MILQVYQGRSSPPKWPKRGGYTLVRRDRHSASRSVHCGSLVPACMAVQMPTHLATMVKSFDQRAPYVSVKSRPDCTPRSPRPPAMRKQLTGPLKSYGFSLRVFRDVDVTSRFAATMACSCKRARSTRVSAIVASAHRHTYFWRSLRFLGGLGRILFSLVAR